MDKMGGWYPPRRDSLQSASLLRQNEQGHCRAKEPIAFLSICSLILKVRFSDPSNIVRTYIRKALLLCESHHVHDKGTGILLILG